MKPRPLDPDDVPVWAESVWRASAEAERLEERRHRRFTYMVWMVAAVTAVVILLVGVL